ncbi:hypothetical protein [Streptomyces sp. NPDC085540]|uniref:hypothetical protein n=1 Tax=Streptomyces sp. NPDC085540 TaxID=3365730 RepID=UPI0037D33209
MSRTAEVARLVDEVAEAAEFTVPPAAAATRAHGLICIWWPVGYWHTFPKDAVPAV